MVLLTALLGAIALVQMSRIHANAEEIATNLLPSVTQTGELRVLLNRMRRAEAGMVGARSAAEVKRLPSRSPRATGTSPWPSKAEAWWPKSSRP